MAERIKAGIIGTGFIGPAHVEAVRRLGFVEMVALAEAGTALAQEKAADLSIDRAYGNYKRLIADPDVQVVHICTPNTAHHRMAKEAIAAGKHVICEKPLAMDSKESRELVKLAAKARIVNAVDFNYRYFPLVQEVRDMVKTKQVGDVFAVHGSYLQDWLYLPTDYNWRVEKRDGGASRAVADVGSHWCDLIQFLTGLKIVKVFADLQIVHKTRMKPKKAIDTYAGKELKPSDYEKKRVTTEDYGTVLVEFDSGAHGVFTVHQCAAGRKNRLYFEIDGSKCAVVWDEEDPERLWIGRREAANQVLMRDPSLLSDAAKDYCHFPGGHPEGYPDGLKNFVRNVYRFIASGKKPGRGREDFSTFVDGHNEIAMVEAVLQSAKSKKWTTVRY